MSDEHHPTPGPRDGNDVAAERVGALRGSSAVGVQRSFWVYAGALVVLLLGVVTVVSFVSASSDNARIERMKDHGIAVAVTVTDCVGNLGGSGSNGAGATCRGRSQVGATTFHEVIGSLSAFSPPGAVVRGVADPARPSTVELASAVAAARPSDGVYLAPGLLALRFVVLAGGYVRLARRSSARDRAARASASE